MKNILLIAMILLTAINLKAQTTANDTSAKNNPAQKPFEAIEVAASFPGGNTMFFNYIHRMIRYPAVVELVGINNTVKVGFTVGKDGLLKNIHVLDSIGSGCDEIAVGIIASSPKWRPALQNGYPVEQKLIAPIAFSKPAINIGMSDLKDSDYGFIFQIKGSIYTLDEAVKILGQTINPDNVAIVLPYSDLKYLPRHKKELYLVKIKNS